MDLCLQITKSPKDNNIYKVIRLPNDLDCLLVSDPDADKSAASMSVDIGDCDDPQERPGLAHFLEHMLFMGTKKYPDQNDYSSYLNKNSGSNNACTAGWFTNFHFDCSNEAFEGALDRFAQFFIAPLLDQSCVERELNAVNSENEMCMVSDFWREYLLFRMSGKKGNPYSKFPVGNLKSLQHPTIREEVLKFYEDHYSSNRMRLCVYGKADIAVLEEWVKTYFSDIPNKKYERRIFKEIPFGKENMGNFWKVVPIKDYDCLEFVWVFGPMHDHYKNDPLRYLMHLFNHEGENSLISFLREEGLATELIASSQEELHLFTTLTLKIKLTPLGYENYKDVIAYTFQYLDMLKQNGAQKWIFEEIQKLLNMKFRFHEKVDPIAVAIDSSCKLLYFPYEDILKFDYFMENYEEDLINQTIRDLTLDNLRIVLISQKCEDECDLAEEWYSVKHTVSPIEQCLIDYYYGKNLPTPKRTNKKIELPARNVFLPQNFDLYYDEEEKISEEPQKIRHEKISEVWFRGDNKFLLPRANIYLHMYIKEAGFGHSIETFVLAKIWQKMLRYHTQEMVYLAAQADVSLYFDVDTEGYYMNASGYNDTLLTVIVKFFEKLADFKPQELEEIYKDLHYEELQDCKNFVKAESYSIANELAEIFIRTGNYYHFEKRIDALERVSYKDLLSFHRTILKRVKMLWFFAGNLKEEDVTNAIIQIEDILMNKRESAKCFPLPDQEKAEIRAVQMPDNTNWIYEYHLTRESDSETTNPNSSIFVLYQPKALGSKIAILNDILDNYLRESFFDQLRTNEQLGYVVYSNALICRGTSLFSLVIQSDVKCPYYLRERIAAFLDGIKSKAEDLSDEDYTKHLESIKTSYSKKPLQLAEEADKNWKEIKSRQYFFNRRLKYIELLLTITKQEFQEFVNNMFFYAPRKLEIHIVSEPMKEENEKMKAEINDEKVRFVSSDEEFKKFVSLYPDFYSFTHNYFA